MRVIRIYGPRDARYEQLPAPTPSPDHVLVRVRAVGICATDVELYDGVMFYITRGMTKYPFVPGHEWSGEVEELGHNVPGFSVGDRVVGECSIGCRVCSYCRRGWYHLCPNRAETGLLRQYGACAEYISFPRYFLHTCNGLSFEDAALIEPTGVALNAVKKTKVSPGDYVAVMGAGPIGLLAVQISRAYGARKVLLAETCSDRLAVGRELGADLTVNVGTDCLVEAVREVTDEHMADVVIEATGRKEVWYNVASILAPRARVGMIGLFAGAMCAVDFDPLVVNEVTVVGCLGGPNMWEEAVSLHERGLVRSGPLITHRLPLADFARAIEISRTRANGAIKVLLVP